MCFDKCDQKRKKMQEGVFLHFSFFYDMFLFFGLLKKESSYLTPFVERNLFREIVSIAGRTSFFGTLSNSTRQIMIIFFADIFCFQTAEREGRAYCRKRKGYILSGIYYRRQNYKIALEHYNCMIHGFFAARNHFSIVFLASLRAGTIISRLCTRVMVVNLRELL